MVVLESASSGDLEALELFRDGYLALPRLCPLRKELVEFLEVCVEQVMSLEWFDPLPEKATSIQASSEDEIGWWGLVV